MSAENACFYCLTQTDVMSCTSSCLAGAGIAPAFPGSVFFGSLLLAVIFFFLALHFRKDLKKFIGFRLISIAFVSAAIFVFGLIMSANYVLKELPILIPIIGLATYLFSYFFSFYLIKASYKVIPFESKREALSRLCRKLKIKMPELYLAFDKEPKAFSVYGFKKAIFLSAGLLEKLTNKEIETVLLHELYHIKRKTGLLKNIFSALSNINFRIVPAPIAELEKHEELEIDRMLFVNGVDTNVIRKKLWGKTWHWLR